MFSPFHPFTLKHQCATTSNLPPCTPDKPRLLSLLSYFDKVGESPISLWDAVLFSSRATLFVHVLQRCVFITAGAEVTAGTEPAVECGNEEQWETWRLRHESAGGDKHHSSRPDCLDASDERLKGVTPVEKHLCVNYRAPPTPSANNGYCVNHLPPVSRTWGRPPSVTFQTEPERKKGPAGAPTVRLGWWYPVQMRSDASEA